MKVHHIIGRDIPEAWAMLMGQILDKGERRSTPRGAFQGTPKVELDLAIIEIEQPGIRPLLPILPPGIPPETDGEHYEAFKICILREDPYLFLSPEQVELAIPEGYHYYGYFVEAQMMYAIEALSDETQWDSNHFCIIAGDNRTLIDQIDPWIWKILDLRVKDGILDAIAYFRSLETWGAFPRFVAAIQEAKEEIAFNIGAEDGKLIIIAKGAHLYDYSWDFAKSLAIRHRVRSITDKTIDEEEMDYSNFYDNYQKPMAKQVKENNDL